MIPRRKRALTLVIQRSCTQLALNSLATTFSMCSAWRIPNHSLASTTPLPPPANHTRRFRRSQSTTTVHCEEGKASAPSSLISLKPPCKAFGSTRRSLSISRLSCGKCTLLHSTDSPEVSLRPHPLAPHCNAVRKPPIPSPLSQIVLSFDFFFFCLFFCLARPALATLEPSLFPHPNKKKRKRARKRVSSRRASFSPEPNRRLRRNEFF